MPKGGWSAARSRSRRQCTGSSTSTSAPSMNLQPSLFESHSPRASGGQANREPLDAASEGLLTCYQHRRLDAGAHPATVAREVSQLRSLARELGGGASLRALFRDPAILARVL